ncbi:MAG: right-handed parallel beta-helix repeat-containing protein [Promethearchaeota archaeon]
MPRKIVNMNSTPKTRIIILITLGILFVLLPMITINLSFITGSSDKSSEYSDVINLDKENIDNNWTAAKAAVICTGNGTYSEPYVIEDLVIDANNTGSGILIENSDVYFKIENCTLLNSGYSGSGILLSYVNNSQLINNNCSSDFVGILLRYCNNNTISGNIARNNLWRGINLFDSNNNTISGNTANNNDRDGIYLSSGNNNAISGNTANYNDDSGIYLSYSDNNTISGNTANNNDYGILLSYSDNNTISGNIMNECGLILSGTLDTLSSNFISSTNLVNGKPLYYYTNEINLGVNDFLNAGQVILVNVNDSVISNLNVSYSSYGIVLYYCNTNTISGNTANNNNHDGIALSYSNTNTISGNTANYNSRGIALSYSNTNTISGNTANENDASGINLLLSNSNTISGNIINDHSGWGIFLYDSNTNTISGNTIKGNDECIIELNCQGNKFSDNGDCTYGQGNGGIPFELIVLISVISGGVVIGVATLLLIIRKRKRIE